MDYYIDILDLEEDQKISLENAIASSLVLKWKGNDNINENFIVGSSFGFTLISRDGCNSPAFIDLLTNNELRYQVQIKESISPFRIIWVGHLLPDLYSEPYRPGVVPVNFTATDGLARLKAKFLPEDFYREEKSVINIIAACLSLTGLELDIELSPAIQTTKNEDWSNIYVDTSWFDENNKKNDAYTILEDLLKSMMCSVYQRDSIWKIEGLNVQNERVYLKKRYNYKGELYPSAFPMSIRDIKQPIFLDEPIISSIVPYGKISIKSKNKPIELPESLTKIRNNGWSSNDVDLMVSEWEKIQTQNLPYQAMNPDKNGIIANSSDGVPYIDKNEWFYHIKNRPYLSPGIYEFTMNLKANGSNDDKSTWINNIDYYITINTGINQRNIISSNKNNTITSNEGYIRTDLDFIKSDSIEVSFLFNVYKGGFFDIIFFGANFDTAIGMESIEISNLSLEEQDFKEDFISTIKNGGGR